MKPSTIAWVVIIILIIAGGAWYFVSSNNSALPTDTTQTTDTTGATNTTDTSGIEATVGVSTGTSKTVTVSYTAQGFSPSSVTINKGDTINFVDNTNSPFWVASAPHPTHEGYDGTTRDQHCAAGYTGAAPFDECSNGTSFNFTFNKTGSFPYHNHNDHSQFGTVVVQ